MRSAKNRAHNLYIKLPETFTAARHLLFTLGLIQFVPRYLRILHSIQFIRSILQSEEGVCIHHHSDVAIPHQILERLWTHARLRHVNHLFKPWRLRRCPETFCNILHHRNFLICFLVITSLVTSSFTTTVASSKPNRSLCSSSSITIGTSATVLIP